ncbi:hypothetical protein NM688_g939 [Phlebia brevispora]|uniref:Uncharacterized protein n=1 Tax=Phlebia brevispora TaxID=194682 RepID=A0ACC1TD51_9APHY|nr:hypothetical protein NM688_g939 [Phlebia brevispora]
MCGNRLVVVSKSTWHAHAKIRKEMQHTQANIFVAKPRPRKRARGPQFSRHRRYPLQNPPKQISRRASDAGSVSTDSDHASTYLSPLLKPTARPTEYGAHAHEGSNASGGSDASNGSDASRLALNEHAHADGPSGHPDIEGCMHEHGSPAPPSVPSTSGGSPGPDITSQDSTSQEPNLDSHAWVDVEEEDEEDDPHEGYHTLEETAELPRATLQDLQIAQAFIAAVKDATLDEDLIDPEVLARLRNPPSELLDLSDPIDIHMLSYEQVKHLVQDISGVTPIYADMCINSCIGFTGPYANVDRCALCGHERYEKRSLNLNSCRKEKVPRRQFLTVPVGPQLQALYRTPEGAEAMTYRQRCTESIKKEIEKTNGNLNIDEIQDYIHGTEYIEAVDRGDITDDNIVLLLSMDGAQLYAYKTSDCWFYIWVILEHAPEVRYKKRHVLVGGVIPGPNKPKKPRLLPIPRSPSSVRPHEGRLLPDGPAMATLSGSVGHKGACGCRVFCEQRARYKASSQHYYPACLKSENYTVEGSSHDDIDLRAPSLDDPKACKQRYHKNLCKLLEAHNQAQYRKIRLETGLASPSIFSGLPMSCMFPMPSCFPADIMHLVSLNLPELLLKLWRGTMDYDKDDEKDTWDWVCLTGEDWKTHGKNIAATRPYLPNSFDRPPRNPAEKMNSGYKAIEFLTYLFGLGPAMMKGTMPEPYWLNYCKLVRGVRLLHQRVIHKDQLKEAHKLLIKFCEDIHALIHMARETRRIGPYIILSQWTMERLIGELVRELRQPSNLYRNLSERALRRAQISALLGMYPELERAKPLPRGAIPLSDGYVLLRPAEKRPTKVLPAEMDIVLDFARNAPSISQHIPAAWFDCPTILRWGRITLPNGQIGRSTWLEEWRENPRIASNIKYRLPGPSGAEYAFGQVQYYFKITIGTAVHAFALLKTYGDRDDTIWNRSQSTVWSCQRQDQYAIIRITDIISIVGVVLHIDPNTRRLGSYDRRVFIVEKMGLDVMTLAGISEDDNTNMNS